MRPRIGFKPYETGIPGVWICSSATPPGGGVHGMGGANAAKAVLGPGRRPQGLAGGHTEAGAGKYLPLNQSDT